MDNEPAQQFRLEPRGFGWHHTVGVSNGKHRINPDRLHGKCKLERAAVHKFLKILDRAGTTEILQTFISPRIGDAKQWFKHLFLEDSNIKGTE